MAETMETLLAGDGTPNMRERYHLLERMLSEPSDYYDYETRDLDDWLDRLRHSEVVAYDFIGKNIAIGKNYEKTSVVVREYKNGTVYSWFLNLPLQPQNI